MSRLSPSVKILNFKKLSNAILKDCCELVVSEFKYEGSILNLSLKLSKIKPFKLLRTFS